MTIDVLLIDDQDYEGRFLREHWTSADVRVVQSVGLKQFTTYASGTTPAQWPQGPIEFQVAIVDLDLGRKSHGFAGGLLAIHAIQEWAQRSGRDIPVVLRTQDIDTRRSFAAVLAAELLGRPLPWWGKGADEDAKLLGFVQATVSPSGRRVRAVTHGAMLIHPVRVSTSVDIVEVPLGSQLFAGNRSEVWPRMRQMADHDAAAAYGGNADSSKFFDDKLKWVIAALNQVQRNLIALHELDGEVVLVRTLVEDIYTRRLHELEAAMRALQSANDAPVARRRRIYDSLRIKRKRVENRLADDFARPPRVDGGVDENRKASHNQQVDQGVFLGTYGDVLCHPEVNAIFGKLYSTTAT